MTARVPLPPHLASRPFTTAEGLAANLGRKRMRGKDLQRPYRGIVVPGSAPLGIRDRCIALQLKLPAEARFSGVTAAIVMGVPLPAADEASTIIHITVPAPNRAPTGRGIRGHSAQPTPGDTRYWRGVRISSPERLWCELGATLNIPDLVAAGDYLVHGRLPFTTLEALASAVEDYPGRRGRRAVRVALPLLDVHSESRRESILRVILMLAGLTRVVANHRIRTSGGFVYRADLVFVEERVILEYQSDEWHNTPAAFRRDMTRISRLEADGWFVIQVNADDLANPAELVHRIRTVLASR